MGNLTLSNQVYYLSCLVMEKLLIVIQSVKLIWPLIWLILLSIKGRENKIIDLGEPDESLTVKKQGMMLYKVIGKEPNFSYAQLWVYLCYHWFITVGFGYLQLWDIWQCSWIGTYWKRKYCAITFLVYILLSTFFYSSIIKATTKLIISF